MKASEAPEKLYLHPTAKGNVGASWLKLPITNEDVEYIRTDALLKKAEEFFEDHFSEEDCKFGSSEWVEVKTDFESINSFLRAFRNYMKGE